MPTVGDRIKEIREHRRLTQDRLAEMSNISKGFLSEIENNHRNPSSESVLRIANALDASIDFLLRGDDQPTRTPTEPVIIPPALSEAAEHLNLSYSQTVELLEAHRSVIARRSNRETKSFGVQEWENLYKAIKKVFG